MDIDEAIKACVLAGHRLDDAVAELRAVGDLAWTGPTADLFTDVLQAEVRAVTRLHTVADEALREVRAHAAEVRVAGGGCW